MLQPKQISTYCNFLKKVLPKFDQIRKQTPAPSPFILASSFFFFLLFFLFFLFFLFLYFFFSLFFFFFFFFFRLLTSHWARTWTDYGRPEFNLCCCSSHVSPEMTGTKLLTEKSITDLKTDRQYSAPLLSPRRRWRHCSSAFAHSLWRQFPVVV